MAVVALNVVAREVTAWPPLFVCVRLSGTQQGLGHAEGAMCHPCQACFGSMEGSTVALDAAWCHTPLRCFAATALGLRSAVMLACRQRQVISMQPGGACGMYGRMVRAVRTVLE
jgi:hypothetical protein